MPLLLGTFEVLLTVPVFASLDRPGEAAAAKRGAKWWRAFVLGVGGPGS